MNLKSGCLLVLFCLVVCVTARKHGKKIAHKHRPPIKRQATSSYDDWLKSADQSSPYDGQQGSSDQSLSSSSPQDSSSSQDILSQLSSSQSDYSPGTMNSGTTDPYAQFSSSSDTEQVGESQPAWCQDNKMCPNFHKADCDDDWVQLNCPRRCNLCLKANGQVNSPTNTSSSTSGYDIAANTNQTVAQVSNQDQYASMNDSTNATFTQSTAPEKLKYSYTMEIEDYKKPVKEKPKKYTEPVLVKEDINITLSSASHEKAKTKGKAKAKAKHVSKDKEVSWCKDEDKCKAMKKSECNSDWMQLNCPKSCGICKGYPDSQSSIKEHHTRPKEKSKKKSKGDVEDIRVTLPDKMLAAPELCKDHVECIEYPVSSCNKEWMKINCRDKCGLCEGKSQKPPETQRQEYTLGKNGEKSGDCYYDGVPHVNGSKWSPGPCTPECDCQNGNVRCTVIQCPKLTCDRQVKKRWSCCPKCLDEDDSCVKATEASSKNSSCCVLPFIYKGVQYETCTSEDHVQPWCSLSENFDLDGKWGVCNEPKPVSKTVENFADTKQVAVHKKHHHDTEKTKHQNHAEEQPKPKVATHEHNKYSYEANQENTNETLASQDDLQNANTEQLVDNGKEEDDEEEILKKYGSKATEEELEVEPEPLDGGYTEWSDWSKCLAPCGGGVQERYRKCSRPPPAFGGLDCRHLGASLETRECNTAPCPVNGGFSGWSPWVECSATCGGGVTSRSRECDNPSPKYGGKDCVVRGLGQAIESKACNSIPCIEKGSFTPWSDWTKCDKTCGGGVTVRRRTCTSPSSSGNGHDCSLLGSEIETKSCNTDVCAVDGGYTPWTAWSGCSRSCGPGITSRHRTCTQPTPSETGKDCSRFGQAFEQKACHMEDCKASGNWTAWSNWNQCSLFCGGGLQTRSRSCIGKSPCEGTDRQTQLCNAYHCPINGNYTKWSAWGECSETCGDGISTRTRKCTSPTPNFGGKTCEEQGMGPSEQTQKCNIKDCQVSRDGGYNIWSGWTECSMSCGPGTMSRYRACDNPTPEGSGEDCSRLGVSSQTAPCLKKDCPIHGNYTNWSEWSKCSVSCGDGSRLRTRSCTNPKPKSGGKSCADLGQDIMSEPCFETPCAVSAKYGGWAQWSGCTKTCGYGIRRRSRRCLGASQYGQNYCDQQGIGLSEQAERCFERSCPVDGNYGEWSPWSQCSASCGGGAMSRFRNCSDPVPMHGGRGCEGLGTSFDIKSCGENYCPVDGGYTNWSEFGPCSRSCGTGKMSRKRTCTNPPPEHDGKDCSELGSAKEVRECATEPCPVNGDYNDWSAWSNCSSSCGNGVMVRSRACTNPEPTFGGQDCVSLGPTREEQNCVTKSCPEKCTCGSWTSWSECDKSCGGGYQTRKRQCTPPKSGVESCEREEQETQLCSLNVCPIDGAYSDWSQWSNCVGDCDKGRKSRSRECNNPAPAFGGRPCQEIGLGPPYESVSCMNDPCPVHGKYSTWSPWSSCSTTCGLGQRKRSRPCDNPAPSNGGLDCSRYGQSEQSADCFVADCPVDGFYSQWTEWSECSKSCGWGHQSRDRQCDSPEPSRGGKDCTNQGDSNEIQPCMMVECPVDGELSMWSPWGECSRTCGEGQKRRKRSCTAPKPAFGGKTCGEQKLGTTGEKAKCNLGPCPETGGWGEWSLWSYCSASCGRGKMERTRQCDAPEPVGGGKPCVGLVSQQKDCSVRDCPVNGNYTNWGPWTSCDVKCGRGFQTRWRSCSNPVATGGGQECTTFAPDYESRGCDKPLCKVDGSWGAWTEWSGCSKTCGDGVQVRTRSCDDPRPQAGGVACYGASNEEKYCRTRDCCDIPFVDLGCFVDTGSPSTMPEVLMTDADSNSPLFSGVAMKRSRKDWDDYMANLICRCAQITNQKGYSHFGIQNLAECRSGPIAAKNFASQGARVAFANNGPRPWVGCLGKGKKQCRRPSLNCVGQDQTNYVYGLKNIAPIHGNYSSWSSWSSCSKSCDRGVTSRRRSCTNPPPLYDGKDCLDIGEEEEVQECVMTPCSVNGVWSGWADWSKCTASCGTGKRTRIRGCSSPAPSNGGDPCIGPDTEIAECYERHCPNDGRWSEWQAWEPCSVSCGYGVQIRTRYCNNPSPKDGGKMCEGDLMESTPCEAKPCPVHGNYADWSNWSGCSRSCGTGSKTRVRKCINPVPRFGGESCERLGPGEEKAHCNANSCPVDGNWGVWNNWSKCSSECGPGVRTRERRCNDPYPNYGGKQCSGPGHESTACSMADCPVDGNWDSWTDWSDCQSDCGVATRERTRACTNPPPAHGGKACEGVAEEYHDCKLDQCPLDGVYSDWSNWGACDQSCGSGHKLRVRSCSNPEPQHGGRNCSAQGPEYEYVLCNTDPCPVDGAWSGWTSWSSCSQTCGMGATTRSRSCSYPAPEFGGKQCDGKGEEKKPCKDFDCCDVPYKDIGCYIDTQRSPRPLPDLLFSDRDKISWKKWKSFMTDLICRCAQEARNKQYTHFGVQHYGECYSGPESWKTYQDEGVRQDFTRPPDAQPWVGCVDDKLNQCKEPNLQCVGKQNTNYVYTIDQVRPIDGNYSDWTAWSTCSSSCGPGSRYRTRSCTNPAPSFSGQPCYTMGSDEEIETCYQDDCPVDGGWGEWSDWSKCSANCGSGTITRTRSCNAPDPGHGGVACKGPNEETVACNHHQCPIDGNWAAWSSWSQCSSSCGNGQQSRKRDCNNPKAEYGGSPCVGSSALFQNCVEKECPGVWGDWSDWSDCSRTCGSGGTHTRSRTCQGGRICHGPRHDTKNCQIQDCPECTKSADVAFILDSSAATDQAVWNRMKAFARGIANAFNLHDEVTRVGLITYATQPKLELAFNEKNDHDEFSDFLNTVTASHGTSDLQRALGLANDKLFVPEAGMRTKVPNVAIFLTADSPTAFYANDSAQDLKEKGVTVVGVGVGNKIDQYELQRVASSPEHTFAIGSLEDAIASISTVANITCQAKPTPPQVKWGPWSDWSTCSRLCDAGVRHRTRSCVNGDQCVGESKEEDQCVLQKCPACTSTLDIVFALPIADSIPKAQLEDAKKFVRGVIDGQQISPQGTHVGLLGYFDYPRVELKLDTFYEKEDILRALSSMEPVDGFNNTRIDLALTAVQNDMFSQSNGVRTYVPKVLVILASGDATDQNLKGAASPLKTSGTTIIPLVVGNLETKAVAPMGTSSRHYFASDTFDNLASKLDKIGRRLCAAPLLANQPRPRKPLQLVPPSKVSSNFPQPAIQHVSPPPTQTFSGASQTVSQPIVQPIGGISNLLLKSAKVNVKKISKPASKDLKQAKQPTEQQKARFTKPATKPAAEKTNKETKETDMWKDWSAWGACSKSCGLGRTTRIRQCNKQRCTGSSRQTTPCKIDDCVVPKPKSPKVVSTKPSVGEGKKLSLPANEIQSIKNMWKAWGAWGACSTSCGLGRSTRVRQCSKRTCIGSPYQTTPCKVQECTTCNHDLDLVLAVDSSDAVSKEGWQKMKSFMTGLLDAFQVSEANTHVGILTFSSIPYLETRLSENFKKDDIALLIKNMKQLYGKQRRIDKALRMASAEFFSPKARGFRDDVSKAFVLITGGNPTEGSEALASAIKPLQQNGVSAVAVGIGLDINEAQLRSIGHQAGHALKVDNYEDLLSYVSPVVKDVCHAGHYKPPPLPPPVPKQKSSKLVPTIPPPGGEKKLSWPTSKIKSLINKWGSWSNWGSCSSTCSEGTRARSRGCAGYNCTGPSIDKEACFLQDCPDCQKGIDLVFAVDGSDDVIDKEFMQEKTFVMYVLNAFKIGKDQTRIGVATYGAHVDVDVPLTNEFDKDSLSVAVNSLIRSRGQKSLENVLEAARTKLFTGSRGPAAKVLVLLTSGKKMSLGNTAAELSQSLKRHGIEVVAVGVGSADVTARDMLGKVATSSSRVFPISSFNELVNNVYLVATSACEVVPAPPAALVAPRKPAFSKPWLCTRPMDIAFALDSSDDVSSFQWQQQKDFVKEVIESLQVGPDGVHTGIMSYGAMPSVDLKLNVQNKDKQRLLQTLQGLDRAVGRRNIANMLDTSKNEIFSVDSGRRRDTASTFVIFQYGSNRAVSGKRSLLATADDLRRSGVRVYVVGVGSKVSRANITQAFASLPLDVMHVPSLSDHDIAKKLVKSLCKAEREKDKVAIALQDIKPKAPSKGEKEEDKLAIALQDIRPKAPSKKAREVSKRGHKHKHIPVKPVSKNETWHSVTKSKSKRVDVAATSCRELKRRTRGAEDGEFPIMFFPHCPPVKIFCLGMKTKAPKEYLTLPDDSNENYAAFHKERLKDFDNCDGPTDPNPDITAQYWGKTRFSKIRLNPKSGLVKQDDFRFAISEGNPVRYGRGGDCFSRGQCRRGGFKINLSGTGVKLRDDVKWGSWGTPKVDSRMINFTKSADGTKISAVCGGSCGGCQPKSGRIYVVPKDCETPPAKPVKRSIIDAMEVEEPSKSHLIRPINVLRNLHKPKKHSLKKRSLKISKVTSKGLKERNQASTD